MSHLVVWLVDAHWMMSSNEYFFFVFFSVFTMLMIVLFGRHKGFAPTTKCSPTNWTYRICQRIQWDWNAYARLFWTISIIWQFCLYPLLTVAIAFSKKKHFIVYNETNERKKKQIKHTTKHQQQQPRRWRRRRQAKTETLKKTRRKNNRQNNNKREVQKQQRKKNNVSFIT